MVLYWNSKQVLILRSRQDKSHWFCSNDPNINIKVNSSLDQKKWFKKSAQKIAIIRHLFELKIGTKLMITYLNEI
jgi:hypothetical protein